MKSTGTVGHPPRTARWLIDLFASPNEGESILGDLQEEFSAIASRDGESIARHWYWRQSARTLGHLVIGPFCTAPWPTVGVAVAGLALSTMMRRAAGAAVLAPILVPVGFRYYVLVWTMANALAQILTGWTIACIAQRRPMAAALSVVFAMGTLMAVTEPIVYLPGRLLVMVGAPIMLGAAMAARRLRRDYEVTAALGR